MAHYQQHPLATPQAAFKFLDQRKIWVDKNLESIKIKDMDTDYLLATMTWLLRRADELKFAQELYMMSIPGPNGEAAELSVDQAFEEFLQQDAKTWMKSTPLFQKMIREYRKALAYGIRPALKLPLMDVVDDRGY